jgi:hypothetical protein
MKPGVQVKASIYVEKLAGAIAVPNQAIVYEGDKAFVLVRAHGRFQRAAVETGARSLTRTVVTKGLADGAQILLGAPGATAPRGGGRSWP